MNPIKYSDRDSDDAKLLKRIMKNLGCEIVKIEDILLKEKPKEEDCETVRGYE